MQKMKIDQAKLELEKVQNSKGFFEEQLKLQHQNAVSTLQAKLNAYQNAEKSLEIAEKIQKRTEIKHKEGLASSFDLLQAKNQVLESQGQYINSLFELLSAKANLDQLQNKN
jgi:outer membrane protein TolC